MTCSFPVLERAILHVSTIPIDSSKHIQVWQKSAFTGWAISPAWMTSCPIWESSIMYHTLLWLNYAHLCATVSYHKTFNPGQIGRNLAHFLYKVRNGPIWPVLDQTGKIFCVVPRLGPEWAQSGFGLAHFDGTDCARFESLVSSVISIIKHIAIVVVHNIYYIRVYRHSGPSPQCTSKIEMTYNWFDIGHTRPIEVLHLHTYRGRSACLKNLHSLRALRLVQNIISKRCWWRHSGIHIDQPHSLTDLPRSIKQLSVHASRLKKLRCRVPYQLSQLETFEVIADYDTTWEPTLVAKTWMRRLPQLKTFTYINAQNATVLKRNILNKEWQNSNLLFEYDLYQTHTSLRHSLVLFHPTHTTVSRLRYPFFCKNLQGGRTDL